MKNKDAVLIATATAAGFYWYAQSRKPKVSYKFTEGIAAGVQYVFSAFGQKVTGTKLFREEEPTEVTKGGVTFIIKSNGTDDIMFNVVRNGAVVFDSHAVLFTENMAGTCNATFAV